MQLSGRLVCVVFFLLNEEVLRKTGYHKPRREEHARTCKYQCEGTIETTDVSKEVENPGRASHAYRLVVIELDG